MEQPVVTHLGNEILGDGKTFGGQYKTGLLQHMVAERHGCSHILERIIGLLVSIAAGA